AAEDVLDNLKVAVVCTAACGEACLHLMFRPEADSAQTAAGPAGVGLDRSSWMPSTTRAPICGGLKGSAASRVEEALTGILPLGEGGAVPPRVFTLFVRGCAPAS